MAGELWGSNGRRFGARERRLVVVTAAAGEGQRLEKYWRETVVVCCGEGKNFGAVMLAPCWVNVPRNCVHVVGKGASMARETPLPQNQPRPKRAILGKAKFPYGFVTQL